MKTSTILKQLGGYGMGLLIYALIIHASYPASLRVGLQSDRPFLALFGLIALVLSFRQTHRLEPFISFALTLSLFGIPLALLWNTGDSNPGLIGALLPWTDTSDYFRIAHQLLDGLPIDLGFSRPFFPGFLAVLLGFTQRNLMAVQAFFTAAVAIACFLASRELRQTHGNLTAAIFLTSIFQFCTLFIGSLGTENLGLLLGGLSFALLWQGAAQRREGMVLLGIFLLTLALCARMGAFLVVPLLVLWGAYHFRTWGPFSRRFLLIGSGLVLAGLGLNSLLSDVMSTTPTLSFGNYAYVLYGLLTGGTWQSVFHDHPEILNQALLTEQAQAAYGLCWDIIWHNPLALVQGSLRAFHNMVTQGTARLTVLLFRGTGISPLPLLINGLVRPLLALGMGMSLWYGLPRLKGFGQQFQPATGSPVYGLLLAYGGGTLLSAPLAPLWDSGWRPYAATMFGNFALLGVGAWGAAYGGHILWQRLWASRNGQSGRGPKVWNPLMPHALRWPIRQPDDKQPKGWDRPPEFWDGDRYPLAAFLGILLAGLMVLGPLALKVDASPPVVDGQTCPAPLQPLSLYIHPGAAIHLHGNGALPRTQVPNIRVEDFRAGLENIRKSRTDLMQALMRLPPGLTLLPIPQTRSRLVLVKTALMPPTPGHYIVCGQEEPFPSGTGPEMRFFRASALHPTGSPVKQS